MLLINSDGESTARVDESTHPGQLVPCSKWCRSAYGYACYLFFKGSLGFISIAFSHFLKINFSKQEGQEALNRSPEFCLKLTYRYLLKADHVPGDTWGRAILVPGALFEQTW